MYHVKRCTLHCIGNKYCIVMLYIMWHIFDLHNPDFNTSRTNIEECGGNIYCQYGSYICTIPASETRVQCNRCLQWFHLACAGISADGCAGNKNWESGCAQLEIARGKSHPLCYLLDYLIDLVITKLESIRFH